MFQYIYIFSFSAMYGHFHYGKKRMAYYANNIGVIYVPTKCEHLN